MLRQNLFLSVLISALVFGCSSKKKSGDDTDYQVSELTSGYEYYGANDAIFVGPQPSEENIKDLKADLDVAAMINLRGKRENRKVKFNPKAVAKSVGMKYYQVPLMTGGTPSEDAVGKIEKLVKKFSGKKVLVYCSSGNRAAGWYGIHYAKNNATSTVDAVNHASKMGLNNRKFQGVLTAYLASSGLTSNDMISDAEEGAEESMDEMVDEASEEAGDAMDDAEDILDGGDDEMPLEE